MSSAPTAKKLAAGQRRTLRAMRERLLMMADEWEELDEFNRTRLTEIADLCEEVAIEQIGDDEVKKITTKMGDLA